MDEKTIKRFEYEEQIFGFSSQLFADNFKNFVQTKLDSAIDNLVRYFREKMIKECKNPDDFIKKTKEMKNRLKSEYKKSLDSENIQEEISKYMNIPEHILLKEDLPVKEGLTVDVLEAESELNALKGRFKALSYLKKKIHDECEMADSTIFILDNIVDKNDFNFKILNTNEVVSLGKSNLSLVKQ